MNSLRIAILIATSLVAGCLIVSDGHCKDDYDCKADRVCEYEECINPNDLLKQCRELMHPCTCEPTPYVQAQFVPDDNCISGRTYVAACDRCCASGYFNQCAAQAWTRVCMCDQY